MKRTSAALLLLLVLVAAACGSGSKSSTPGPPKTPETRLTPTAYRAQVNALCAKAKQELGKTSASSATSQASATAALEKALGIFQPISATLDSLKPPASLAAGHKKLVTSLAVLVNGGQALIAKLKGGTPLTSALTGGQVKSLGKAVKGMEHGFTTLGLTTCTRLISGK